MGVPIVLLAADAVMGQKVAAFVEPEFTVVNVYFEIPTLFDTVDNMQEQGVAAVFISIFFEQEDQDRVVSELENYNWRKPRVSEACYRGPKVLKSRPCNKEQLARYSHLPFMERGPHVARDMLMAAIMPNPLKWEAPIVWSPPLDQSRSQVELTLREDIEEQDLWPGPVAATTGSAISASRNHLWQSRLNGRRESDHSKQPSLLRRQSDDSVTKMLTLQRAKELWAKASDSEDFTRPSLLRRQSDDSVTKMRTLQRAMLWAKAS